MSLTIKQAFETLSDACSNGMKNPFFVMRRLKESFADVASKVVVDDGGVNYVAVETKIGTFLGKDLYRQVIHSTETISISANQSVVLTNIPNIIPRNIYCMAYENGIWYRVPTEALMFSYDTSTGNLGFYAKSPWAITEVYAIIEYEKVSA